MESSETKGRDLLHLIFTIILAVACIACRRERKMKNELTVLLQKGYRAEREFIAALSDEERNAQGTFERWTAKDIIAHNSYWRKHHAENLLAILVGTSPTPDG
jgi:hypothetical protein